MTIPVIDIFAGPGGLGEGFSAFETEPGHQAFKVVLSIEKEPYAHQTLRLRSFFRQFPRGEAPDLYYDVLRQKIPLQELPDRLKEKSSELFEKWKAAEREAFHAELGASEETRLAVAKRIDEAIINKSRPWVLVGGPPCQAYSVVGRARNKGKSEYRIEDDHRSSLYRQYLRIIADHGPAIFIMENVKGILSAKMNGKRVFDAILSDLQDPQSAFGRTGKSKRRECYRVVPVIANDNSVLKGIYLPRDFVVESEKYGIPQVRHRVILIGIRQDIDTSLVPLEPRPGPSVSDVISDLPKLRSGLSRKRILEQYVSLTDGPSEWVQAIISQSRSNSNDGLSEWLRSIADENDFELLTQILNVIRTLESPLSDRGGEYVECNSTPSKDNPLRKWYRDTKLKGACNHQSRAHLESDLARYLFASCYAKTHKVSPKLHLFPAELQPSHRNAASGDFDDRFRVQIGDAPSTTITSHISKDGHYFIHPDAIQCRSLTVREAARLQTFPDNYYFCGPRTTQYVQVGNAVPPMLAEQIAKSIWDLLENSKKTNR